MKIPNDQKQVKKGSYSLSKPYTLKDQRIVRIVDEYKKNYARKLTPIKPDLLTDIAHGNSKWRLGDDLLVSIKVDGETIFFIYDSEDSDHKSYFCNASVFRVWTGLPANTELEKLMEESGIKKAIICGELFASHDYPPDFEKRSYLFDFLHFNRQPESEKDLERIGFRAYDIIQIDQDDDWLLKDYTSRYKKLSIIFPPSGRCAVVNTQLMNDNEIYQLFNQEVLQNGHEGLVIRNPMTFQGYKVKPIHTLDAVIIGVVEGQKGTRLDENQLSTCIVALRYPNGVYQVLTRVGGGLTDAMRTELWGKFRDNFVPAIGFTMPTHDGRAFRMVRPILVAHINYMDVSTHSSNTPIMQNTLRFDEESNSWEVLQPAPFVSVFSPRFVKDNPIREDKTIDPIDVSINQITELIMLDTQEVQTTTEFPKSELLARYVFTKEVKGNPEIFMIRKVLAWKTNKKEHDPSYPNYVIFTTDYSPGRKTELDRKVKISESENQMWKLLDRTIKKLAFNKKGDGLTKGWSLYSKKDNRSEPIEIP